MKYAIITTLLLSSLLLIWCTNFEQKAEKEIEKLQNEYNDTSTVVKKLYSDIENKQAHLYYLSWKISNLEKYLWKESQKVEVKNDIPEIVEEIKKWLWNYQCADEDFITEDYDTNYTYLDDCNIFEWVKWCYIRMWDWKECFRS